MIKVIDSFAKYQGVGSHAVGEKVKLPDATEKHLVYNGFAEYVEDDATVKEDKTNVSTKEDKTSLQTKAIKTDNFKGEVK